ncbi:ATP-dependent DNA helicase [Pyruvatibacter mobilis]|nr:ATP-dependent DNA helicase [Pyruvatibacter mobilis]GGD19909.1 DNA helicase [Pyruvatibacter mobilis]
MADASDSDPDMPSPDRSPTGPATGPLTRRVMLPAIPALVATPTGAVILTPDGEVVETDKAEAAARLKREPHLIVHTRFTARRFRVRLGDMAQPYDALELFGFTFPARFCTPTPQGLARALGLEDLPAVPQPEDLVIALATATHRMVATLADAAYPGREQAAALAATMDKAGWAWGPSVTAALGAPAPYAETGWLTGLESWKKLAEWEEPAPRGRPGNRPVAPEEAGGRLRQLVGPGAEDRQVQRDYAAAASRAFLPREPGEPHVVLAEAGTGTGKTLGYIAPASLWAERNDAAVWLSTYTKNLQRQLDQELTRLYPDPEEKAEKIVLRKGRENYLCLLNFEEAAGRANAGVALGAGGGNPSLIPLGLIARWISATRDGDMLGGDFPSWLVPGAARAGNEGGIGLTDRRGECVYSACTHYRRCFIERAVRRSRAADIVVANHALVLTQAANAHIPDASGEPLQSEMTERVVFDEGHHVFDAADSAFAVVLSGQETSELRRWIRGAENRRSRRSRGLRERIGDLVEGEDEGMALLEEAEARARVLAGPGWQSRLDAGAPTGPAEQFLSLVRLQVFTRHPDDRTPFSLETEVSPPIEELPRAASAFASGLAELARPLRALAGLLSKRLQEDGDSLDIQTRIRIEAAHRGIIRRTGGLIPAWTAMLQGIGHEPDEGFVEWFEIERSDGRERDVAMRRHWLDPTRPLADVVLDRAQGVLLTSATLRDEPVMAPAGDPLDPFPDHAPAGDDMHPDDRPADLHWASAEVRTGAMHLPVPAIRATFPSPFDYAHQAKVIAVHEMARVRPDVLAGAYRTLFEASGGGGLGIFTAIARLRAVQERLAPAMAARGINLYAQHVDAMDVGTLVDIFRSERDSCLLGTDAVRDGVDVPGDALRMLVFDRVPWPRPDILHKARRAAFGGGRYDDLIARLRLRQAFGRLIRSRDDRGVFVILAPLPTKLLGALPRGVTVERMGLAEAAEASAAFLRRG